ncbi:hypothetical protein [Spartinivicinus poritis]|uniref:Uncharacterized protein n=1 Tax=Spartinivicinus poritis TaxID=2994640 RepID=A0ABT5U7S4_9GAMM|nr:hypothetical protein [Spartinivicinus sp. A2-2]MDE1462423.1 hypothetical protein [Spartinivicinus sp. A2-2]
MTIDTSCVIDHCFNSSDLINLPNKLNSLFNDFEVQYHYGKKQGWEWKNCLADKELNDKNLLEMSVEGLVWIDGPMNISLTTYKNTLELNGLSWRRFENIKEQRNEFIYICNKVARFAGAEKMYFFLDSIDISSLCEAGEGLSSIENYFYTKQSNIPEIGLDDEQIDDELGVFFCYVEN